MIPPFGETFPRNWLQLPSGVCLHKASAATVGKSLCADAIVILRVLRRLAILHTVLYTQGISASVYDGYSDGGSLP